MTEKKEKFESVYHVLNHMQRKLNAPKNQYNKFGNYHYRNVEDIQEGLKKVLPDGAASYVSDEIVEISGRIYVKATATLCYGDNCISNTAYAREPSEQKGMSVSQVTGAASSYARKYALGGLYMVDDQKDADSHEKEKTEKKEQEDPKRKLYADIHNKLKNAETAEELNAVYKESNEDIKTLPDAGQQKLYDLFENRMSQLSQAPF